MATVIVDGKEVQALKGAPSEIAARANVTAYVPRDAELLAAQGYRVLAVAGGLEGEISPVGLLALQDLPRADSRSVVARLSGLGVRVAMVTGDSLATARAVASQVGIAGRACSAPELRENVEQSLDCAIFAGVFPEDKFRLVSALQHAGHVVGMTGDGVNDAPALKQAEVGIAVATATDVAKASASLVLTNPGLTDTLAAVETSRRIYQRMLTYTLNKIIKTIEIALFLSLGVIFTHSFIVTPLLVVLLLFTNDFLTMSIATDRVRTSTTPDRWHIGTLMLAGAVLGGFILLLSLGLFFAARDFLVLLLPQLQTLVFATLVLTGQGMVYLVRERRHFWNSAPSPWMIFASVIDLIVVWLLATRGILMAPLPSAIVGVILVACVLFLAMLDFLKVPILKALSYR
jgi:H+-transporting ATPase